MTVALGHADRREPMRAYLTGLCLPGERKSIEPMAARVDPRHVRARHQSMHHFVANAPWDGEAILRVARDWVLGPMARHGPVAAWIVDDTAYPKKGRHSVGVARQYCGPLGKDNCQVAVSVSLANDAVSLPVAYRLYLPESWAQDRRRRRTAGVPDAVEFQPKWQLALAQIRMLQAEGMPPGPIVADAGYGDTTEFREALTAAGLAYVVGVKGETTVWRPGQAPLPPKLWRGRRGRPSIRVRRTARHQPVSLKRLAAELPAAAWQTVTWREGTRGAMRARFTRLRVRPAHRDEKRSDPRPEEWLVMEWPRGIGAHEILALDPPRPGPDRRAHPPRQAPLADRAGLSRAQGRTRPGSLRGAGLARLPSSRRPVHCGVCVPRGRARDPFPPESLAFLHPARLPKDFKPRGAPGAA
jgi:SRSO17 transposase